MPTYDYECNQCGEEFEAFQSMTDDPISTCGRCGGPLRRLIAGGLGVIFKGDGFYTTDSKLKAPKSGSPKTAEATSPPSDGREDADPSSKRGEPEKKETPKEPSAVQA